MKTYTATFSNGQTVTRTSDHAYITAAAYVSNDGRITGSMFSESPAPKENRCIYVPLSRRIKDVMGAEYVKRSEARNAEAAKIWKWEIVKAEPKA